MEPGDNHRGRLTRCAAWNWSQSRATRPQAVAAATEHPECRVYDDYRRLLEDQRIDAVNVVLPSYLHYDVASDVLRSGRHLLLEKPMALSIDDCTRLIELAKSQQRLLAVGHELRLSSLWGRVKQIIDAGAIGEPCYCLIELWRCPYRLGSGGWRCDINRVGSWILEEPIHFFDLARWYFSAVGQPQSVFAQASSRQPGHPELHDNFSAMLTFAGGQYAVISQTLAGWEHHQVAKIAGTTGTLWASWSGAIDRTFEPTFSLKVQRGEHLEEESIARPSGEVYELVDEVECFVNAIHNAAPLPCTGDDGRWSVAMCLKAVESLSTDSQLSWGDSKRVESHRSTCIAMV